MIASVTILVESEMHRLGLAFVYRMVPVIVVSILYGMSYNQVWLFVSINVIEIVGIYIAILCAATRGLW